MGHVSTNALPTPARAPLDTAAASDAALPVWDLSDLYAAPDDPRLAVDSLVRVRVSMVRGDGTLVGSE